MESKRFHNLIFIFYDVNLENYLESEKIIFRCNEIDFPIVLLYIKSNYKKLYL